MSVSGISGAGGIPADTSGNEVQSIEQKIQQAQNQLQQVKSNDKLSKEEKEKRVENLEKQIKNLMEQKAKMQQGSAGNASAAVSADIPASAASEASLLDVLA